MMPFLKVEPLLASPKGRDYTHFWGYYAFGRLKFLLAILILLISHFGWTQFKIPSKPTAQTSVYDYVNLLSTSQKSNLEHKLVRYADSTSTQIVVAIISSTDGENINFLGAQWGEKWGIGQANKDNGVLVLLAKDDRRIAINTGYGVEALLTDALSKRIIESVIIPEFKTGDYYNGLNKGADAIFKVLTGEFQGNRNLGKNQNLPFDSFLPFLIFLVILFIIFSRKGRGGKGNNRGNGRRGIGSDLLDIIILSNMGRGGYRSGSSGGGFGSGTGFGGGFGGGGFGGGGFGGGGASGGW